MGERSSGRDERTYARPGVATSSFHSRARWARWARWAPRPADCEPLRYDLAAMIEINLPPKGSDPGRSFGWRLGATFFGLVFLAAGGAVILWPALLSYAVGGMLGAFGLFLLATALAARGR